MKIFRILTLLLLFSCTKHKIQIDPKPKPVSIAKTDYCSYTTTTQVTYAGGVKDLFMNNCMPCHQSPGSGGINLDSYSPSVTLAKSGELIQVITYTEPNGIMMPPPPQKQLDSCEIKALTLWIEQGCPQ